MYPINTDTLRLFQNDQAQTIDVTFKDGTKLTSADVLESGMAFDRCCVSGKNIEVGAATTSELTLKLNNANGQFDNIAFEGKEFFAQIGIKDWADPLSKMQYIPIGYYTVDETPRKLATLSLSALDRMIHFDKDYSSTQTYPATVKQILLDACSCCGVTLATSPDSLTNYDYVVTAKPEVQNTTWRHILQWLGEITGTCAYMDWDGKLRMEWYTRSGITIAPEDRFKSNADEKTVSLSGVKIVVPDSEDDSTDKETYAFEIENNPLVQDNPTEIFRSLSEKLNGLTYLPYDCTTISYPFLYPLDIITYIDKNGVPHESLITNATHKINGTSTISAVGETATKRQYSKTDPMTKQQIAMIETDFVKTKVLTAEIANINKIFVGEIVAIKAEIDQLTTVDLEAINAHISNLTTDVAEIETLLSGHVSAGSTQTIVLNAQNASIDTAFIKSGIAAHMQIGDLMAGVISTNRFSVTSDSGKFLITDNTLQIKDESHMRVQLGKDATGDYSIYVWDKTGKLMFDALGLTEDGIQKPIIRDDMVSGDANIAGDKLNISSVVKEINDGTSTIKSSVLEFDPTGQSFNVVFQQLSSSVDDINSQKMYRLTISSSKGSIFKNGEISTTLYATVFSWDTDVTTDLDDNQFAWTRSSEDKEADKRWNTAHFGGTKQIDITKEDVLVRATFFCDLVNTTTRQSILT